MDTKAVIGIVTGGLTILGTVLGIVVNANDIFNMFKKDDDTTTAQQAVQTTIAENIKETDVSEKIVETEVTEIAETEKITENQTEATTEKVTEKTTEKATEADTEKITEAPTETPPKSDGKLYSLSALSSSFESNSSSQYYAIDEDDNMLYYINNKKAIYQVNLSTKEESLYKDLSGMDIEPQKIFYNPFDNDVYCLADEYFPVDPMTRIIFNIRTENLWENNDFYSAYFIHFTEKNKVLVDKVYEIAEISIDTGNKYESLKPDERGEYCEPFFYDDWYYWVNAEYDFSRIEIINDDGIKGKFDNVSEYAIYNDEVYIMKKDFSIYKVNMEKLLSSSDSGNTLSSLSRDDATLDIYIDISDVKQTGKCSLKNVSSFAITNSGDVVVYDGQDNKLKLIEKN